MANFICSLVNLHNAVFETIQKYTENWLLGLSARLIFASVLLVYFLNSAITSVGTGFPGFLIPTIGAYGAMIPPIAESYGYDPDAIPLFPWKIIVFFGIYAEILLPIMIVIGLFTRIAALGFVGFITVMTTVDILFHNVDAQTIGNFFDRIQNSAIADQRLLWLLPLIVLIIRGPGLISVDAILGKIFCKK